MKYMYIFVICMTLLIASGFASWIVERTVTKEARATWNWFMRSGIYKPIWRGNIKVWEKRSRTEILVSTNNTSKYALESNFDTSYDHAHGKNKITFDGKIEIDIMVDGILHETKIVDGSIALIDHRGGSRNISTIETFYEFWMPFKSKYKNVSIVIVTLEPDEEYLEDRENCFWSISASYNP